MCSAFTDVAGVLSGGRCLPRAVASPTLLRTPCLCTGQTYPIGIGSVPVTHSATLSHEPVMPLLQAGEDIKRQQQVAFERHFKSGLV